VTVSVSVNAKVADLSQEAISTLHTQGFITALMAKDPTLWGPSAVEEASIRLGWVDHPGKWQDLAAEVEGLRDALARSGVSRVFLCGMGGSSLGPEVMAAWGNLPLTVIDSTHPDQVAPYLAEDLSDAVIVVSSKSGGTVETDSQKRAFEEALHNQGLDPLTHLVVVSDPGSPLSMESKTAGYRVFDGDPTIGGRFSALSPFGIVPVGLAGLDLEAFLADAGSAHAQCSEESSANPALVLGIALASGHPMVNKLLLRPSDSLPGFGDWIEQLVAESTGKQGHGLLPVVNTSLGSVDDALTVGPQGSGSDIEISGSLADHIVLWEFATVVACAVLGVNPFDQPNVESAKVASRELLHSRETTSRTETVLEGFSLFAEPAGRINTMADLIPVLVDLVSPHGYIAVCVFAPTAPREKWRAVQNALESRTGRPVTLGFGPRFLHSTGQLHKGGAPEGLFLQIIQRPEATLPIPGREFDFADLMLSQAHGDARVLAETGQPVVSLTGTRADIEQLWGALGA
jgi:glucose-6-phosphate isomerase